jgi:glycosyltransferase involved in cell wall biosynthesis
MAEAKTTVEERREASSRSAPTVCVVCPCYNEIESLPEFFAQLTSVLDSLSDVSFRVLFVEDGSTDGTLEELERIRGADSRVEVYSLSRNFGHQIALTAGLDVADGDAVILSTSSPVPSPAR